MKNAVLVSLVANAAALSTENDEPNLKATSGFKHAETTIQLEQMAHLAHSAEGAKNEGLFAKIKTFFNENVFMTEEFEKFNFTSQDLRVLAAREEKAEKEALAAKKDGVPMRLQTTGAGALDEDDEVFQRAVNQVVGGAHKSDTAVSEASKKMRALLRNNTAFGHWIPPADGDDAKLHLNTEVTDNLAMDICPERCGCNDPYQRPTKLDWGICWYQNANSIHVSGKDDALRPESKKALIFLHGFIPVAPKSDAELRGRFVLIKNGELLHQPWMAQGWNVGTFFWDMLGAEPHAAFAEAKMTNSQLPTARNMRYFMQTGQKRGYYKHPFFYNKTIGDLFLEDYRHWFQGKDDWDVRVISHSVSYPIILSAAYNMVKFWKHPENEEKNKNLPMIGRISITDPMIWKWPNAIPLPGPLTVLVHNNSVEKRIVDWLSLLSDGPQVKDLTGHEAPALELHQMSWFSRAWHPNYQQYMATVQHYPQYCEMMRSSERKIVKDDDGKDKPVYTWHGIPVGNHLWEALPSFLDRTMVCQHCDSALVAMFGQMAYPAKSCEKREQDPAECALPSPHCKNEDVKKLQGKVFIQEEGSVTEDLSDDCYHEPLDAPRDTKFYLANLFNTHKNHNRVQLKYANDTSEKKSTFLNFNRI